MPVSKLDILYRKLLLSKFFTKGWGDPEHVLRLLEFRKLIARRETCYSLVDSSHPIKIEDDKHWTDCYVSNGSFLSPLSIHLPDVVHPEVRQATFQMIVPKSWKSNAYRPMCIHLAGTGDHYFWKRRQIMVKPLLKHGIASIILENPFYGTRKPQNQVRSCLLNVSDIFVMGGCLILECIALLHWCEKLGFGPLGVTGLSMGGHMASLAASSWPKPLVLVPCLSWSTASGVFTEGVMSEAIDWDFLQNQYYSNKQFYEIIAKLCSIVDNPTALKLAEMTKIKTNVELPTNYVTPHTLLHLINESNIKCDKAEQDLIVSEAGSKPLYSFIKKIIKAVSSTKDTNRKISHKEALWFMRGLMDECTHLKNFPTPVDTSLIIALCAQSDAYVPRDGSTRLEDIWPGATIRYLDCGHVSAYIKYLTVFRESIIEAFERAIKVCPSPAKTKCK